ncbi:hypothetical protein PQX77_017267 [Marasmius sp. AFHP31]|nr:hypothetical protein PQX77_017267 [Marasmius sp. AFHP31]
MNNNSLLDPSSVRTSIEGTSLFRNSFIVTGSDRRVISQFLLDAEEEMKGYEVEINQLRTAMHLLETKKSGLKKTMDRGRSLLSPVHRLPTETLTEIFSHACKHNCLSHSLPPQTIKLSRVCGRWWEVIRSAPKLWSSIIIWFSFRRRKLLALEKLVRLFLDRSATQPLYLQLCFFNMDQDSNGMSSILHVLHDHAARWQVLDLMGFTPCFPSPPRQHGFPALQEVILIGIHSTPPNTLLSLFRNAQSLRTFDVSGNLLENFQFDIPFHQIKTLVVRNPPPRMLSAFIEHLARFPALETLYINEIDYPPLKQDNATHHLSQTITSVTFEFEDQRAMDFMFRALTLPSLTSLQVGGTHHAALYGRWSVWQGEAVADFLSRSSCSVTSLCLKNVPITDVQTISLLQLIPTLASLDVEEIPRPNKTDRAGSFPNRIITQPFLQRLTVEHEVFRPSHPFLPLLNDITITMREDDTVERELFNAVASRWIPDTYEAEKIGVKSLKSVAIRLEREGKSKDRQWLKSLECFRVAGLSLRVDT